MKNNYTAALEVWKEWYESQKESEVYTPLETWLRKRASQIKESPAIPQQPQGEICPQCGGTGIYTMYCERGMMGAKVVCGVCRGTGKLSPVR